MIKMGEDGETIEMDCVSQNMKRVFGGTKFIVCYAMKHQKNGYTNRYLVECEIEGIPSCDVRLHPVEIIHDKHNQETTNEETLTDQAALDLFQEQID